MASIAQLIRRRRARKARLQAARRRSQTWMLFVVAVLLLAIIGPAVTGLGSAAFLYLRATADMPTPLETINLDPIIGATELYDRSGAVLLYAVQDPLGDRRTWLELDDLPPYVISATLLAEDPDFLEVTRFDPARTLGRLWGYIIGNPIRRDATLTGRLVRNVLLPRMVHMGLDRSLLEIALVSEVNRLYSPEEVLAWHLNTNYYGSDAYGIEAAAQVYLGKSARDLTVDEAALLAAIPTAPRFNPFDDPTAAYGRQTDLLRQMLAAGAITQAQFDEAIAILTPLAPDLATPPQFAPEFSLYARRQTEEILDSLGMDGARLVSRGGLRVTTTLDMDLYEQSECALRVQLARLGGTTEGDTTLRGFSCVSKSYLPFFIDPTSPQPPDSGQVLILDVHSGEILTMIGAVTVAEHQPGPTLQPFVYFEGFRLEPHYTPASMVLDIPLSFPGPAEGLIYTPTNPDGEFLGPVNLRDAMGAWRVPPAAEVANAHGINNIAISARLIGLSSLDDDRYDLSILQRGGAVSVLDVAYAYNVLASLGEMPGFPAEATLPGQRSRNPIAVLKIEDANGNVLWEYDDATISLSRSKIFEPGLGYLIADILSDTSTRRPVLGDDNVFELSRPAAVVNGLTADFADDWTVGYTPQRVVAVHLSRTDGQPLSLDPYGERGAASVWRAVMEYAHDRDNLPRAEWQRPPDVQTFVVCERSGLLPGPDSRCPTYAEIFLQSVPPHEQDTYWQVYKVNSQTGQLASVNTPAALVVERLYFIPPPTAQDWWVANGQPLPPKEYDTVSVPEVLNPVQILQPSNLSYVGGVVDIRGSLDPTEMAFFQLSYGEGVNPDRWFDIGGQQTVYEPGTSLAQWDTSGLDGFYTLRLSVELRDGSVQNAFTQVTVDNIAPTITLDAGGTTFRWPETEAITLQAIVSDNLGIERVDFYVNGQFIGEDREWPYSFDWEIERPGIEVFSAVAYDQVGNQAEAQLNIEITRGS
ncbi:MAG: hypothetical protein D6712_02650 [Chloroflexi bacterium]|nr:MAG: hypothetical protein D6712_02650 [Chloroflexota bacterium]